MGVQDWYRIGEEKAQLEFHQLGFEQMVPTAASHNRGVHQLMDTLADYFGIPEDQRLESSRKRRSRKKKPILDEAGNEVVEPAFIPSDDRGEVRIATSGCREQMGQPE